MTTHTSIVSQAEEFKNWQEFFSPGSTGIRYFERYMPWYEKAYQDFRAFCLDKFAGRLLQIAEVGAGSGLMSYQLASITQRLELIDMSPNALRYAKTLCPPALRGKTKFTEGSIFALPYPDNSFDLVHTTGVLEHYTEEEILKAFKELTRITKPGGSLFHSGFRVYRLLVH